MSPPCCSAWWEALIFFMVKQPESCAQASPVKASIAVRENDIQSLMVFLQAGWVLKGRLSSPGLRSIFPGVQERPFARIRVPRNSPPNGPAAMHTASSADQLLVKRKLTFRRPGESCFCSGARLVLIGRKRGSPGLSQVFENGITSAYVL